MLHGCLPAAPRLPQRSRLPTRAPDRRSAGVSLRCAVLSKGSEQRERAKPGNEAIVDVAQEVASSPDAAE
jgi:hypothetical protein